jgi:hypothetical protein
MVDVCVGIEERSKCHNGMMAELANSSKEHQQQLASPFADVKTNAAPGPVGEASGEACGDVVPSLRSLGSVKSILKSGDLDSQGSEGRVKRSVSWHDFEGKHLHTVREYTPG